MCHPRHYRAPEPGMAGYAALDPPYSVREGMRMTTVDQQKIRRARTGLIAHDPALAQPGYTLFAPMSGDGTVYLIDMAGGAAPRRRMPRRPGLSGHPLPNGDLFYVRNSLTDLGPRSSR